MPQTIYKYELDGKETVIPDLPFDCEVLHFAEQRGKACIWIRLNTDSPTKTNRTFRMYATGEEMPNFPGKFIGTCLFADGFLVFHCFMTIP